MGVLGCRHRSRLFPGSHRHGSLPHLVCQRPQRHDPGHADHVLSDAHRNEARDSHHDEPADYKPRQPCVQARACAGEARGIARWPETRWPISSTRRAGRPRRLARNLSHGGGEIAGGHDMASVPATRQANGDLRRRGAVVSTEDKKAGPFSASWGASGRTWCRVPPIWRARFWCERLPGRRVATPAFAARAFP
jgi:hypothetical protein